MLIEPQSETAPCLPAAGQGAWEQREIPAGVANSPFRTPAQGKQAPTVFTWRLTQNKVVHSLTKTMGDLGSRAEAAGYSLSPSPSSPSVQSKEMGTKG